MQDQRFRAAIKEPEELIFLFFCFAGAKFKLGDIGFRGVKWPAIRDSADVADEVEQISQYAFLFDVGSVEFLNLV